MGTVLKLLPILLAAASLARAEEALDLLRKTADAYKSAKGVALEGIDRLEEVARGKQRITTRRFHAWRLGNAMRVEFDDGAVRLTDGRTEWSSPAQGKAYTKRSAPWDSRGRRAFQEFYYDFEGIADFVKTAGFIAPPGKSSFNIEVTYELPGRIASEVTKNYWIDAENYAVLREISNPTVMMEHAVAGGVKLTRTVTFSKADLKAPVDASRFKPPSDEPLPAGSAPDFALSDLGGAQVTMKEMRGKAVVLYFWATWCSTCREEMPKLEKLALDYRGRGLVLLGINDEDPAIAAEYLKANGHTLRSLVDRWQDVYKQYRVDGIPAMILVAPDGRIVSAFGYGETVSLERGVLSNLPGTGR
jgi:peroxiredoxin